jgi:hypothetical protein
MVRPSFARMRRAVHAVALVAVVTAAVVVLFVPSSDAAPAGNCTYYNNASHSKVIGQRGYDCCNNYVSWGKTSSYYTCGGCFICFPPPR